MKNLRNKNEGIKRLKMNLLEALKEVKNKLKDTDNIKRFMVVRRHYNDEGTKATNLASIWVKEGNISLDHINMSMDDLVCNDWEIMTAYKKDNPGILPTEINIPTGGISITEEHYKKIMNINDIEQ